MGRPTVLSEAVVRKVRHALRCGTQRDGAAKYAGIARSTFYLWLAQGEAEDEGPYRAFLDMVLESEGTREVKAARKLRDAVAAGEDWAVKFMLERRCGWAAKSTVTHEDGNLRLSADGATDIDVARSVLAALESRAKKPEAA